jgi:L-fuculose-phosphate aldolase
VPAPGLDAWRETLVEVGRDLYMRGLVTSHGGNLSVRRPAGGALITATGAMLGHLEASALVAIDDAGAPLQAGAAAPSSNSAIHLAIYAAHPRVGAVLHAHPPYAVARSIAFEGDTLHPVNFEARLLLGSVPIVTAVESALPEAVATALADAPVVLVRGHGSFAMAGDLWQALHYTTALEEAAQVLTHARDGLSSEGVPLRRSMLLALERDAHERWQGVVAHCSPDATRLDGWTLKDVVAHVAAWHRFAIHRLEKIERGEAAPSTDADEFNADVKSRAEVQSWGTVLAEAADAHAAFVAAIEKAPTSVLEGDDGLGAFVITVNGLAHYAEHMRDFEGDRD